MTTTLETPPAPPEALPGLFRRHRSSLLIGLALVAAVGIAIVLGIVKSPAFQMKKAQADAVTATASH